MSATAEQRADAIGRINLLLEEYRSLRADLVQRTSSHASLLGFLAAAAALITKPEDLMSGPWVLIALTVLAIGFVYWWLSQRIKKALGVRVSELEDAINALAEVAYGPDTVNDKGANAKLYWESWLLERGG